MSFLNSFKSVSAVLTAAALLCVSALAVGRDEVSDAIAGVYKWKKGENASLSAVLTAGDSSGDWYAFNGAQSGLGSELEQYLQELSAYVERKYAEDGGLDKNKITEWHRIAITVSALGGDPTCFGGVDLIRDGIYEPIVPLERQGINGLLWAAIAADCCNAALPEGTERAICDKVIERQNSDGGFSLRGASDPDITAMAVRALVNKPEYKTYAALAAAALKGMQNSEGGFCSGGKENCESTAQAVIALCAVGENPIKAVDRLMAYRNSDGGFAHVIGGESNSMASVQALEALLAYENAVGETAPVSKAVDNAAAEVRSEQTDETEADLTKLETAPVPEEEPLESAQDTPEVEEDTEDKAEKAEEQAEEAPAPTEQPSVIGFSIGALAVISVLVLVRRKRR